MRARGRKAATCARRRPDPDRRGNIIDVLLVRWWPRAAEATGALPPEALGPGRASAPLAVLLALPLGGSETYKDEPIGSGDRHHRGWRGRSEEHTSELQS